ncbi:MAG: ABC transporter ATP-binding protein [Acidimicrobiales bacterium]
MSPGRAAAVRCEGLVHVYGAIREEVTALRGVDLSVEDGGMLALLGPSGSGKSTLLWILAGLIRPTAGTVDIFDQRLGSLSAQEATYLRRRQIGIVLQNPARNLFPHETALGNVLFPQRPSRLRATQKRVRALNLLDAVGIGPLRNRVAGRLSGGEQQRLAVAIALANEPRLLLADEPTSQLDRASADAVLGLLRAANQEHGTTVVAVTHDPLVGAALGRTITIRDGRVGSEGRAGRDYVVVGRDGTIQLPDELQEVLPPGSLAEATRVPKGVLLSLVDPEQR